MRIVCLAVLTLFLFVTDRVWAADTYRGAPTSQWKSVEEVKRAAVEYGFSHVVKVLIEDGCCEAVSTSVQGKIVGVLFDPVMLRLARVEDPR
jgi:hypothetical protein